MTPDVVYVSMNWPLRFCILQYTKSHATPDVPMNVTIMILYTAVYKFLCDSFVLMNGLHKISYTKVYIIA